MVKRDEFNKEIILGGGSREGSGYKYRRMKLEV